MNPTNSKAALMAAVAVAPTTVYFDVENSFQNYAGGVYSGTDCGASTNHASELYLRLGDPQDSRGN